MRIICKMVWAQVWHHPARMILTSLAIAAAACVVIWVVSGYDALIGQFGGFASDYLGRYDLIVLPEVKGVSAVPQLVARVGRTLAETWKWRNQSGHANPGKNHESNLPPEEQTPFGREICRCSPAGARQPGGGGGRGGMRPGMMFGRMPSLVGAPRPCCLRTKWSKAIGSIQRCPIGWRAC